MTPRQRKVSIGVLGCGAIGSRIAKSVKTQLKNKCTLTALFDLDQQKAKNTARQLQLKKVVQKSLTSFFNSCDFVVEAVNADNTPRIIRKALQAHKNVLVMSVGKLLDAQNLFKLAEKNQCALLFPSGAISGLDAIKAASLVHISSLTLTTCKPTNGFQNTPYLTRKGIDVNKIKKETILFEGNVQNAVKFFPQNINVAASLALAAKAPNKLKIRIITSPKFKNNSHTIEANGDFGCVVNRTENVICPDNPKTSYLAVLSGIETLKQFFSNVKIGT